MKWLSKLLKKPAPQPSPDPGSAKAAASKHPGQHADGVPVARAPLPQDPPSAWVAAICQAPNKEQAQSWLAGLRGDDWLGEVALGARFGEIRHAAARRIESTEVLERVVQKCRDKDKRVHRHCADLLKQRRQRDASGRRAAEIADEVGALLALEPLPATRLLDLKQELDHLPDAGSPGQACQALIDQALARLRQETEAQRDLHTRLREATELATACAAPAWPDQEQARDWRSRRERLAQAPVPAWLVDHADARKLTAALAAVDGRLATLDREAETVAACETFLASLELAPADADAEAAWQALAKPANPDSRHALEARWQTLKPHPPAAPIASEAPAPAPAPRAERSHPALDPAALGERMDRLEQALAEGHLADADHLAEDIKRSLGGQALHGKTEARLHGLQARLAELRGWARWGTGQARDTLVDNARALLESAHPVEHLADAITALREEWKRLNAHSPATRAQWEHFDAALEQAYQPVAAWRAEQATRQEAAKAAKDALCAGWEAEWAGFAWDQADYKSVETRRSQLIQQWRAAPATAFRDERALRKRFDALIADIDQHLDSARQAEQARREQLIAAAQALDAEADLRQAMATAKDLQKQWSQQGAGVHLKRADEQRLWGAFRAACNRVFERQEALRAEQSAQREARAQSRQNLLDGFAARLAEADDDTLKRDLAQFRVAWDHSRDGARDANRNQSRPSRPGHDKAEKDQDPLDARARALQKQAQARLDALCQGQARARFDLLARKAALAERLEAVAAEAGPLEAVLAETRQAWSELPALTGKAERRLALRLEAAAQATRDRLSEGRQLRESLLLDLEIALELPSPAAFAEARRERQLGRLQDRFGTGPAPAPDPDTLLEDWHATPGRIDAAFEPRLSAIVDSLVARATRQP